MLYNWSEYALKQLFESCGVPVLAGIDKSMYQLFGIAAISRVRMACWAYAGKVTQLSEIWKRTGPGRVIIVNYDDLIRDRERVLPAIYAAISLPYAEKYATRLSRRSLDKADRLSRKERLLIKEIAEPVYIEATDLALET